MKLSSKFKLVSLYSENRLITPVEGVNYKYAISKRRHFGKFVS
jgi:hypothetical protein